MPTSPEARKSAPASSLIIREATVADANLVADLLTGSGRMPAEGEELVAWMKDNERVWRT